MSDEPAGRVHVLPSGTQFEVREGESIMDAARRHGYSWPTICEGAAECTACYLKVLDGDSEMGPMSVQERTALERVYVRYRYAPEGEYRLACRATVCGEVTVFKRSVRRRS